MRLRLSLGEPPTTHDLNNGITCAEVLGFLFLQGNTHRDVLLSRSETAGLGLGEGICPRAEVRPCQRCVMKIVRERGDRTPSIQILDRSRSSAILLKIHFLKRQAGRDRRDQDLPPAGSRSRQDGQAFAGCQVPAFWGLCCRKLVWRVEPRLQPRHSDGGGTVGIPSCGGSAAGCQPLRSAAHKCISVTCTTKCQMLTSDLLPLRSQPASKYVVVRAAGPPLSRSDFLQV